MTRIIDISPPISPELAVFPGDSPVSREVLLDTGRGGHITLSTLRMTVHAGSHADGPNHYGQGQPGIDAVALERFLGPCHVIDAHTARGANVRIGETNLILPADGIRRTKVLIRTGTQPDKNVFNPDFAGLEPSLIDRLASLGVRTIGVDTPSVDTADSKDLPAHAACLRGDITILEGLVLDSVEPGEYELIALPLKLVGFDGSPVRAVLRTLD